MVDFPQKLYESDEKYAARLLPVRDATIARLQDVITNMLNAKENDVTHIRNAAWNDAIEAAAEAVTSIINGRVYFSQRARRDDQEFTDRIRALKRPN